MQRRNFIRLSTAGTAGLCLWSALADAFGTESAGTYESINALWQIMPDGSYNLMAGPIMLEGCYPAIDGETIKPLKVETSTNEISYTLTSGVIRIRFARNAGGVVLESELEGFDKAPHWVYPIAQAEVRGANRYFKQGNGFGGPSGVFNYPKSPKRREEPQPNESWSNDSYLTTGFIAAEGHTMSIAAFNQKEFANRSTHYNRQHRFGLIDRHLENDSFYFESGFSTENIPLSGLKSLPALHFVSGTRPYDTFRELARQLATANGVKQLKLPRYHWCSWYEYEHRYDITKLNELIQGLKTMKPAIPLQTLQIDDGYSAFGDWIIANEQFSQGIDHMANTITSAGYAAGIWIGPFMVMETSKVFREHPEWMLHDVQGNLIKEGVFRNIQTYVLDTSHPDAFAHLRNVFRTFRKWGITYYKTDFLDWGFRDSTRVKRHTPGKTSAMYYNEVLQMIRQEIGPESFWLGCIAPFAPVVGYVDGIRVANDVWAFTKGSAGNMIQEMFAGQYLNGVLWHNDPDTLFLRDYNTDLTAEERNTLSLWGAITGNVVVTSDRFHRLSDDMLRFWRFIQPGPVAAETIHPYWDVNSNLYVAVRALPRKNTYAVVITNPDDKEQVGDYPLSELINQSSAWVFEWGADKRRPVGNSSQLSVKLKPHQSLLFYLSADNEAPTVDLGLFGYKIKGL